MNNAEKRKERDKRVSVKWKLCIIVICIVPIALNLTVKLTEHIRKNDTQGRMEGGGIGNIYVQKKGETLVYTSADGAITWSDERNPDFYMQIPEEKRTDSIASIPIEIVNVSDNGLTVGDGFLLYIWNGNEWIPAEVNYFDYNDIGYFIRPHTSYEMTCNLPSSQLKVGKYLITKTVICENDRSVWTLSTEFTVE